MYLHGHRTGPKKINLLECSEVEASELHAVHVELEK